MLENTLCLNGVPVDSWQELKYTSLKKNPIYNLCVFY